MHRLLLRTKAGIRDAAKPLGDAAVGALTIRPASHHALFRSDQDREPVRPRLALHRPQAPRGQDRPRQSHRRLSGKIAGGDRDHSRRRLGQSRPRRRRIRPSRSHLGARSGPSRRQPHRDRAAHPRTVRAAAARRQAGADFREPPRQLGTAGAGRGRAWAGCRDPVSPAQHRLRRPRHREDARGQHGNADSGRPRCAAEARARRCRNGQHVAMLVDQYLTNGVDVTFFGRKTKANPMMARLLRQVECPIHGVRIIRLPGHRFRAELSEEVKPVRDAAGQDRHSGHDAGDHVGGRGLDPRISRPMAVAASPLAVSKLSRHCEERSDAAIRV